MNKINLSAIIVGLTFLTLVGPAHAWNLCFQDTLYATQLEMNVEGDILRGQATFDGAVIGALTGTVGDGAATFGIAYSADTGFRFYNVSVASLTGTSWGIYDADSNYYDNPHGVTIVRCAQAEAASTSGSGASH